MLTLKKRRILFWCSVVFFMALLVPVFLFSFGYGVGSGFKIQRTGSIAITASVVNATVSANNFRKKNTSFITKNALIKNLVPGEYKVEVKRKGFWDWKKNLKVDSEKVTAREVLLIPLQMKGEILGTTSPVTKKEPKLPPSVKRFWELPKSQEILILGDDKKFYRNNKPENKIATTTLEILRKSKHAFISENEQEIIIWDEKKIDILWIVETEKMPLWMKIEYYNSFLSTKTIKDVRNYPGRLDYLIVQMENGVFVIEKETPNNNISPLYKGKSPKIISVEVNSLILLDDDRYIKIELL